MNIGEYIADTIEFLCATAGHASVCRLCEIHDVGKMEVGKSLNLISLSD